MKTLGQIEQEITHYGNARYTEAEWFEDVDKCAKHTSRWRDVGNKILYPLLDSLAAWDTVVREAIPGLQAEYEALKAIKDAKGRIEREQGQQSVSRQYQDETPGCQPFHLNATGLARLEYLRGILGE